MGMGWNFTPRPLGEQIHQRIVELVLNRRVRSVVGRVVDFEDVPAAVAAMANRETVGRTIVKLY
jgi:NADPH:quinone reductase-like Zn-dependent oxidoreductase